MASGYRLTGSKRLLGALRKAGNGDHSGFREAVEALARADQFVAASRADVSRWPGCATAGRPRLVTIKGVRLH